MATPKQYQVGDYLANINTVLLEVVAVLPGDYEIYAMKSIKNPLELKWYTRAQLEHEHMVPAPYSPDEFLNANVGDQVRCGTEEYKQVLARQDNLLLLSRTVDKTAKAVAEVLSDAVDITGASPPPELIEHIKSHGSPRLAQNSVDNWYEMSVMALMNWKLVRE